LVEQALQGIAPDHPVNALVLVSAGKKVRGAQIKELHSVVRTRLYAGSSIVKSAVVDESLADDALALDILVFGSRPDACTGEAAVSLSPADKNEALTYGIPAFLRQSAS
jgi:hypothetical protein